MCNHIVIFAGAAPYFDVKRNLTTKCGADAEKPWELLKVSLR